MSLLAAIFDWESRRPPIDRSAPALGSSRSIARRPAIARVFRTALLGVGAGSSARPNGRQRSRFATIDRRSLRVGDLRLDNREELTSSCPSWIEALDSDLALAVAAYDRWGPRVRRTLVGDFAFVHLGRRAPRGLRRARSISACAPLVYRRTRNGLVWRRSPLSCWLLPEIDRSPNDRRSSSTTCRGATRTTGRRSSRR